MNIRILFWCYIAILALVCLYITPSYGITGDEITQNTYGQYVWDYLSHGGHPEKPFEEYHPGHDELKYYGGLFDGSATMFIQTFKIKDEYLFRHYWNCLFGIFAIIFAGLICKQLTGRWVMAILGSFLLTITPRFFGEMFSNPKDIPFAAGYIISIYYIIRLLNSIEYPKWSDVFGLSMGIALAIGVRIGGLLVIVYFGLFYIISILMNRRNKDIQYKRSLLLSMIAVGSGYILACLWWPYALENILSNPIDALKMMSSYPLSINMLYNGLRINTAEMPSNYLIKWLYIGTPVLILIGTLGFVIYVVKNFKSQKTIFHGLLLFAFIFPIFYIINKKSVVYDALRHIIFVLPLMAIMTTLFISSLLEYWKENNKFRYGLLVFSALASILPLRHMLKNHPNQYVYFNELFGGVKKAFGYYETDYYHMSGKEAADWLKKEVLIRRDKKVMLNSNMGTFHMYFQGSDTSYAHSMYGRWRERDHLDWDYYVAYSRFIEPENLQSGGWPPSNVVHAIKVDEVPVCVIIERKNKADIEAYNALQANNFQLAVAKYEENLGFDKSNEYIWYYYSIALANTGRIDDAIKAIQYAISLNSSNPDWEQQYIQYNELKSKMGSK